MLTNLSRITSVPNLEILRLKACHAQKANRNTATDRQTMRLAFTTCLRQGSSSREHATASGGGEEGCSPSES